MMSLLAALIVGHSLWALLRNPIVLGHEGGDK